MPLFEYEEIDQLTKEDLPVYKIPKSIQQTIDITAVAKNGVFCHTPKKEKEEKKLPIVRLIGLRMFLLQL